MENSKRSDDELLLSLLPKTNEEKEEDVVTETLRPRIWAESKKMWVVAGPAIFTRFSTFGVSVITQAFIGHVGPTELAAYALVFTVLVRFANGVLLGMASALETLCGQAYGAKQHHMLGIYLQRSWIVLTVCTFLMVPLFIFTTPLLRLLGQDEAIASMAGTIALWFIPINFSYLFSFTFQTYLQSQSKNLIITYLAALSLSLHALFSWLSVVKFNMGVAGAMGSMILAMWIPIFGQFGFVLCGGCPETWKGFSWDAFRDLWLVIKLSFSSGFMICLELWYNTILVLLTGNMTNAEVAIDALSICLNISGWEMMISVGFLAAAGVRVANELGAGSARNAKFAIKLVVATSLSIGVVLFTLFLLFRGSLAYVFTESKAVADAVADLSALLAFTILLNSVQPVLSGVAVGAGWQSLVAYVNLACYYLVGIPFGIVLGYVIGFQVKGIWVGMIFGTGIQTILLIIITYRTDWDNQVALAQARVNKWLLPQKESKHGHENL
ncbi:Protein DETOXIFICATION [Rhynchospora pubera]|uniref:Protein DETOXIFICATION n=1 Tax=Rhynchospora pubera TaxID=906938 RepID=A0AAV8GUW9_9POAL|nr:Protein DETOXIFICATION [Rhynchospora pubera]